MKAHAHPVTAPALPVTSQLQRPGPGLDTVCVTAEPLTPKVVCLLLCKWPVLWKLPGIRDPSPSVNQERISCPEWARAGDVGK